MRAMEQDRKHCPSPEATTGRVRERLRAWWGANEIFLRAAALLFLANQLFEIALLRIRHAPFEALCQFDCDWYRSILQSGYHLYTQGATVNHAANWAFFPAFPALAEGVSRFGLSDTIALLLTGRLLFLFSIFWFARFVHVYNPRVSPYLSAAVLAFSPWAVYGSGGYTEPLFLGLACASFVHLRKGNYVTAGLYGAALGGTRLVGGALGISFLVTIAGRKPWKWPLGDQLRTVFAIGLIPLGLALFSIYLYYRMGDGLAFMHVQRAWGREITSPWVILTDGFRAGGQVYALAMITLLGLGATAVLFLRRRPELGVFALLGILIPLSTNLASMPRYVMWLAPVLLVITEVINVKRLWVLYFPVAVLGLSHIYSLWLIRHGFVI